ncbi:hypothetical protein PanWU01x14_005260 [Parasponia andersonii]|uniref:Transmembrane protein n=1 Tax=Parasponia andersonii TaxID=3476 RepID=A0A2P5E3G3_PARAD|nr:hypothetical protein PanWU01x14_005260 [Parasponia andersonii]
MTAKCLSKPFKELFIVLALLAILISAVASKPVVRKGGGGQAGGGRGGRGGRGGERGSEHSPLPYFLGHSTPHHI